MNNILDFRFAIFDRGKRVVRCLVQPQMAQITQTSEQAKKVWRDIRIALERGVYAASMWMRPGVFVIQAARWDLAIGRHPIESYLQESPAGTAWHRITPPGTASKFYWR